MNVRYEKERGNIMKRIIIGFIIAILFVLWLLLDIFWEVKVFKWLLGIFI